MSYCRTSSPDSQVYMYGDVNGRICCCGCFLLIGTYPHRKDALKLSQVNSCWFDTRSEAILHLRHHRLYGHGVPLYAEKRLLKELREEGETLNGGTPFAKWREKCLQSMVKMYRKFGLRPHKDEQRGVFLKRMRERDARQIRKMLK